MTEEPRSVQPEATQWRWRACAANDGPDVDAGDWQIMGLRGRYSYREEWFFAGFMKKDEAVEATEYLNRLETENVRLRTALVEIKANQGKVCEEFEICTHVACQSSTASWMIADATLHQAL